jgi:hypothetical protein
MRGSTAMATVPSGGAIAIGAVAVPAGARAAGALAAPAAATRPHAAAGRDAGSPSAAGTGQLAVGWNKPLTPVPGDAGAQPEVASITLSHHGGA